MMHCSAEEMPWANNLGPRWKETLKSEQISSYHDFEMKIVVLK